MRLRRQLILTIPLLLIHTENPTYVAALILELKINREVVTKVWQKSRGHNRRQIYFERAATAQRRIATTDQTASTNPNGHAPCRKP
jgi:hypothetical protein